MRCVIDLTSLEDNFSGIERYALSMTKEIIKQERNIEFILLFKNNIFRELKEYTSYSNVNYVILKGKNKLIFNQITLLKALNKIDADKYVFFAFPSPILFRRKGMYNTIHDMGAWDVPNTIKTLSRIYFKYSYINAAAVSEGIITVSNYSKERITSLLNIAGAKVHVIPSGVSDNFYIDNIENTAKEAEYVRQKYHLPKKYIMCLSTLEPRKNMTLLLDAFIEVMDSVDYDLVIVGRKGWKIDKLMEKSERLKNRVHLTGFIEDKDVKYIYKLAKCFVFTSVYEGFGLPPLEALKMNVPVISSNAASLPEVLEDRAIYFQSCNKSDLSIKLIDLDKCIQVLKVGMSDYQVDNYNFKMSSGKFLKVIK